MKIFITSGATVAFPALVSVFDKPMLESLARSGVKKVVIQYGHAEAAFDEGPKKHRLVQGFAFKPSLEEDIARADLVISHAGSGSILDVLRSSPDGKPLIIVVNSDLMDNHQLELANALDGHQALVSSLSDLEETITKAQTFKFEPLAKPHSIQSVLHQELVNSQIYSPIQ